MRLVRGIVFTLMALFLLNTTAQGNVELKGLALEARIELSKALYAKSVEADRGRNTSLAIKLLTVAGVLDPGNKIYINKTHFLNRYLKRALEAKYYQALHDFNSGRLLKAEKIISEAIRQNSRIDGDYENKFQSVRKNILEVKP